MIYFIYRIIRLFLFPFFNYLFPLFLSGLKSRIEFERNFIQTNKVCDFTFEVSSEGELEQVKTPLIDLLKAGKTIELLYCSPSVDHKCRQLADMFENLVIRPLPLITFCPFGKKYHRQRPQGHTLVMCRYDFFPELIEFGRKHPSILMSASAQNFQKKNIFIKHYLKKAYKSFNFIITATESDLNLFNLIGIKVPMRQFDFRALSILERQADAQKTIKEKSSILIDKLIPYLKENNTVIFGSFWDYEIDLLNKELIKEFRPLLAPHKLNTKELDQLKEAALSRNFNIYLVEESTTESQLNELLRQDAKEPGIWICTIKGILCELYTYFDHVYVGGGFGESIHSVLEPFLAGAHVYFGPINYRSSEKISIEKMDSSRVHPLLEMRELYIRLKEYSYLPSQRVPGQEIKLALEYRKIISWLNW